MKHTDKTTTTASARPENVRTYTARFTGRQLDAIGIFEPFETTVEARNEEEARIALYDRFEHISNLSLCLMGHETASAPETRTVEDVDVPDDGPDGFELPDGTETWTGSIPAEKPMLPTEREDWTREYKKVVAKADKAQAQAAQLAEALRDAWSIGADHRKPNFETLNAWREALAAYEEGK